MSTDSLSSNWLPQLFDKRIRKGVKWREQLFRFITSGLFVLASTAIELAWPRLVRDMTKTKLATLSLLIIADALLVSGYHQLMHEFGLIIYDQLIVRLIDSFFTCDGDEQVENLIIKDANVIRLYMQMVHYWWSMVVQVLWCAWQIVSVFGYKRGLSGLLVMMIMFGVCIFLSRWLKQSRHHWKALNDERMRMDVFWMQSRDCILAGSWQETIRLLAFEKRNREYDLIRQNSMIRLLIRILPSMAPLAGLITTVKIDGEERPSRATVLEATSYYNMLRSPLQWLPSLLTKTADVFSSLQRIALYLDEHRDCVRQTLKADLPSIGLIVIINNQSSLGILTSLATSNRPCFYSATTPWLDLDLTMGETVPCRDALECAHLAPAQLLDRKVSLLSDGQRQRVLLAKAYASGHSRFFLHEPLVNMDRMTGLMVIKDLIQPLSKRACVVISTSMDRLIDVADYKLTVDLQLIKLQPLRILSFECALVHDVPVDSSIITMKDMHMQDTEIDNCNQRRRSTDWIRLLPKHTLAQLVLSIIACIVQQIAKTRCLKRLPTVDYPLITIHIFAWFSSSFLINHAFLQLAQTAHRRVYSTIGRYYDVDSTIACLNQVEWTIPECSRSMIFTIVSALNTLSLMVSSVHMMIVPCILVSLLFVWRLRVYRDLIFEANREVTNANKAFLRQLRHAHAHKLSIVLATFSSSSQPIVDHQKLARALYTAFTLPGLLDIEIAGMGAGLVLFFALLANRNGVDGSTNYHMALSRIITLIRTLSYLVRKLAEYSAYGPIMAIILGFVSVDDDENSCGGDCQTSALQTCTLQLSQSPSSQATTTNSSCTILRLHDQTIYTPDKCILLKHVNLDVKRGQRVLLTGPSGIGKSTLLWAIMNPTRYGVDEVLMPPGVQKYAIYNCMPIILPDHSLSARQQILMFFAHCDVPLVDEILLYFGVDPNCTLPHHGHFYAMLITICRLIVRLRREETSLDHLILLDEVTAGMDQKSAGLVEDALWDLIPLGVTIIYVSHHPMRIARFDQHIHILKNVF